MSLYVIPDLNDSTKLTVIDANGWVPAEHYGTPPVYNGETILDGSKLRKRPAWIHPDTQENQFDSPIEFYRDYLVSSGTGMWKTPVPTPAKQYWLDRSDEENPVWRDNAVDPIPDPAPENTELIDTRKTPAPFWYVDVDPAKSEWIAAEKIARARILKKEAIEAAYTRKIAAPILWTNGRSYQISSDLSHGLNVVNAGKASIEWTAVDNTRQQFTAQDFKDLCVAVFDRGQDLFLIKRMKKTELDNLTTLEEIAAYNLEAGWP